MVIYCNPLDFPNKWVVREWDSADGVASASIVAYVFETLDEARRSIPLGMTNIGRYAQDDPVIHEVWAFAESANTSLDTRTGNGHNC
jgi:hypothetical protein